MNYVYFVSYVYTIDGEQHFGTSEMHFMKPIKMMNDLFLGCEHLRRIQRYDTICPLNFQHLRTENTTPRRIVVPDKVK